MSTLLSDSTPNTPTAQGYRMPAEWEPHTATWLSWPRPDGISFPDAYERVQPALCAMVDALADSEPVKINVCDEAHEKIVRGFLSQHGARASHVTFHRIPTNEPWCRDHGPIFVTRAEEPKVLILDWGYNAWGGKYPPFDRDDVVPTRVSEILGLPVIEPGMILEGGSIELNGSGTLITTKACLLNPNRNPSLNQQQIEQRMRDYLGVSRILWLGDGIEGDDTDGHVDDLTRFVSHAAVVTVVEENKDDNNHAPLAENLETLRTMKVEDGTPLAIHTLAMPAPIVRDGQRLPASYANFYVANNAVLLPVFDDPNDAPAIDTLARLFPGRRIAPIDCRELIWGLGAFHCLTQQQPAPR